MHARLKLWLSGLIAALMLGCAATPPAPPAQVASAATPTPIRSRGDDANVDRALLERGYHPRTVDGELKYCRRESVTGTLFSSMVCLTPEAIKAREDNAQKSIGMAHRGDGGCAQTPCT